MKAIIALTTALLASVAVIAFLVLRNPGDAPRVEKAQSGSEMVVMRTNGGLLEVSMITSEERFDSTTNHTILGVNVGKTVAQIRVPAVYRYHVSLAKEWNMRSTDEALIIIAPTVKPSLPVAIDTAKLEGFSSGVWSQITGSAAIASLQKSITASLEEKAATPQLMLLQREAARNTVAEFVQKWVVEQPRWIGKRPPVVLVFFADEPLGGKAAPLLAKPH